ncbi:phage host specificity protein [Gemmobacter tilapiae]|uniref:Phage host specificity protein n=1 Tax=Neogemmobacter tilapiae TaxID=875041 RepID=A0A918WH59_9RHOB|nr:phage host specificity protein [Gemmobacter tilapiae]
MPDPKIEAVEGAGNAPAYRGLAYVMIEDLDLTPFGNRVPQFSFEVVRSAQGPFADQVQTLRQSVRGVALIPGTGEYALATARVHFEDDPGVNRSANVNSPLGGTDFVASLRQLNEDLPGAEAVSLVVSWFGNDLRCGQCTVRPLVEQKGQDGQGMPWHAGGIARSAALEVPRDGGKPVYGGTPADASVMQAIQRLKDQGKAVMFYPFVLMTQLAGNGQADPWSDAPDQPVLPWRGRITTSKAPGQPGSPDGTMTAAGQVDDFFGSAAPGDFVVTGGQISYSGPDEWRYRRFILHYAHLCAQAGGVDSFCIGSELRGLTQIRGDNHSFPTVQKLRQLAGEVRGILGPGAKIGYAADWSEYSGYQAGDNHYFHLDPLWADPDIDFVGIDNYMPLSDWREGDNQADAGYGSIYNLDYLKANIAGGEGYDWYYDSPEAQAAQRRTPITDGAYGEPWVFRYKDIRGWWGNEHHNRIGGAREALPTAWVPGSKPIWFTEYGCAAVDRGTNEPNKFVDPKSSESSLPRYSNGRRDDLIQMQYLRAMDEYWADPANNPLGLYGGRMVDMARAHVWTWDARPFPWFPNDVDQWGDGENYPKGHWLNGRATNQPLAAVVAEICETAGVSDYDVSRLSGLVRGYWREGAESGRAALQPLMLAYGFDAVEREGKLVFSMREGTVALPLEDGHLAVDSSLDGDLVTVRAPEAELAGRLRVVFPEAEGDYEIRQAEARFPDDVSLGVSETELPLVMTRAEARVMAERWLAESRVARDTARFALPPSQRAVGAGQVVRLRGQDYRIDRVELGEQQLIEAVRVEKAVYEGADAAHPRSRPRAFLRPLPVHPVYLDLPVLTGDEQPHAPWVAVTARPWPGAVACWTSARDEGYGLNRRVDAASIIGRTLTALPRGPVGLWDRGPALRVRLSDGLLSSADADAVLDGANVMAIGDGTPGNWEIFQFANAVLVDTRTYDLSLRLRGQFGSDALMPGNWPVGSRVVLLDGSLTQLRLATQALGQPRHLRAGQAGLGYADDSVNHQVRTFEGVGLRPYAPVHLTVELAGGDHTFHWVRRTRIDGDAWGRGDVPMGEASEQWSIRVIDGGDVVRELEQGGRQWTYTAAMRSVDGIAGPYRMEVAQISDRYGPGLYRAITV